MSELTDELIADARDRMKKTVEATGTNFGTIRTRRARVAHRRCERSAAARDLMKKSVEATVTNFGTIRTGRANPHLLDRVMVDYYGAQTQLQQLATGQGPAARRGR